jgi:hypothetical protein
VPISLVGLALLLQELRELVGVFQLADKLYSDHSPHRLLCNGAAAQIQSLIHLLHEKRGDDDIP